MIKDHTAHVPWKEKIYRAGIHIPVGALTAWFAELNALWGILFFAGFFIYEITEDWRIKDHAYLDIFGWLVGFAVGVGALWYY